MTRDRDTLTHYIADPDRTDNLSRNERVALQQLLNNKHIIIKPADKGSKIVITDKQQYAFEAHRQLNNNHHYKKITSTIHTESRTKIIDIILSLYHNKFITAKQHNFLCGPDQLRPRLIYFCPKSTIQRGPSLPGYHPADQSFLTVIAPRITLPNIYIPLSEPHSSHHRSLCVVSFHHRYRQSIY